MKAFITALFGGLFLCSCATIQSPHAFAVCKTLDVASTVYALEHGAVETGVLMKPLMAVTGYPGLIIFSGALIWAVYHYKDKIPGPAMAVGSAVTCAAAVNNVLII